MRPILLSSARRPQHLGHLAVRRQARCLMADFDQEALQSRGPAPADVADALTRPNVILPA